MFAQPANNDGGVPFDVVYPLRTEHLLLRPLEPSDAADLLAYRSLPEVTRYLPFEPMTAEVIAQKLATVWARREIVTEGDAVTIGIEVGGRIIGDVMLSFTSSVHRGGEVGWILHPRYQGLGFAAEAAHAVLHVGFDTVGLHRVVARIDARNDASLRLATRLGMRREAHLVANEWLKGEWTDEVDFAILEAEWELLHTTDRPCAYRP